MPEHQRHLRGLVDASAVVGLERLEVGKLPIELAVSGITMAELAAGPHAATDAAERGRRQDRLQRAGAAFVTQWRDVPESRS
ncbi:MAG: PIN domain-containing protein [Candidatus Dormibacteria bacterium]